MTTSLSAVDPEVAETSNIEKEEEEVTRVPCFFRYFGIIVRIWGFLTIAGLGVSSWWLVTRRSEYPYTSWYTIAATVIVGILELIWLFNLCAFCRDDGGVCCTFWRLCVWIDNWRKTIIYILIAIPEYVIDKPALVPYIAGSIVILLGILYLFKTCETCRCCQDVEYSRPRQKVKARTSASQSANTATTASTEIKDEPKEPGDDFGLIKSSDSQQ